MRELGGNHWERDIAHMPMFWTERSDQTGVVTESLINQSLAHITIRGIAANHTVELILVRLNWILLTLAFEIPFCHFALGLAKTPSSIGESLTRRGITPFGLLVLLSSQMIALCFQGGS
jgi:hypothetical protein